MTVKCQIEVYQQSDQVTLPLIENTDDNDSTIIFTNDNDNQIIPNSMVNGKPEIDNEEHNVLSSDINNFGQEHNASNDIINNIRVKIEPGSEDKDFETWIIENKRRKLLSSST
ncbi:hypothetical protein K501DRAFT_275576 [Backusella circina FSU 941]|nr:hypothetical protein K501DRAFT_275576 [Backusella circina FSU 941]